MDDLEDGELTDSQEDDNITALLLSAAASPPRQQQQQQQLPGGPSPPPPNSQALTKNIVSSKSQTTVLSHITPSELRTATQQGSGMLLTSSNYSTTTTTTSGVIMKKLRKQSKKSNNNKTPGGIRLSDDDSDSGTASSDEYSDCELQPAPITEMKKKTIWRDVLLEEEISTSLGAVQHRDRPKKMFNRGVETYVPSGENRVADPHDDVPGHSDDQLWNINEDGESRNVKARLGKRPGGSHATDDGYINYKNLSILPEEVTEDDDERVIVRFIARQLNEPKTELLLRVVQFVGKAKALDLYSKTATVEECGGIPTHDGKQRRTAGGAFLHLLKSDKSISKDVVDRIFAVERENQKKAKKEHQKNMRKRKYGGRKNYSDSIPKARRIMEDNQQETNKTETAEKREEQIEMDEFDLMEEPDIQIL